MAKDEKSSYQNHDIFQIVRDKYAGPRIEREQNELRIFRQKIKDMVECGLIDAKNLARYHKIQEEHYKESTTKKIEADVAASHARFADSIGFSARHDELPTLTQFPVLQTLQTSTLLQTFQSNDYYPVMESPGKGSMVCLGSLVEVEDPEGKKQPFNWCDCHCNDPAPHYAQVYLRAQGWVYSKGQTFELGEVEQGLTLLHEFQIRAEDLPEFGLVQITPEVEMWGKVSPPVLPSGQTGEYSRVSVHLELVGGQTDGRLNFCYGDQYLVDTHNPSVDDSAFTTNPNIRVTASKASTKLVVTDGRPVVVELRLNFRCNVIGPGHATANFFPVNGNPAHYVGAPKLRVDWLAVHQRVAPSLTHVPSATESLAPGGGPFEKKI